MCTSCGCNITQENPPATQTKPGAAKNNDDAITVDVLQHLLSENDEQATRNRTLLNRHGILAINLMSSPGSGKTRLLESTIDALNGEFRLAVIEGDLETENDAQRIRKKGVKAVQISTGTACHLNAHMLHNALQQLDLATLDIIFIENVGNLVCPASFDLGQHRNLVLLSVTEGDDKPAKYPVMFRSADIMIISKADLLEVIDDFDPLRAQQGLRNLANSAPVFPLSAKTHQGLEHWINWIRQEISPRKSGIELSATSQSTSSTA